MDSREKVYREKALEYLPYSLAVESMGIYPQSVSGGKNPYETRTERMEGHNEAIMSITHRAVLIEEFITEQKNPDLEDALLDDNIFVRIGKTDEGEKVILGVNCNDVFYWACADAEDITVEELGDLTACLKLSPKYGIMLWCCRKRKMRPQSPWYERFSDNEKKLFDACGPERDPKTEG